MQFNAVPPSEFDCCAPLSAPADESVNAMKDSFVGTLKQELVHHEQFATKREARIKVIAWIEGWYNREGVTRRLATRAPNRSRLNRTDERATPQLHAPAIRGEGQTS